MKIRLIFILSFFSIFSFGQNRDINTELEKIIIKSRAQIAMDISTIDLLEKTWKNGQQTWTIEEEILLKSVLSEAYLLKDDRKALELAKEAFDLAEKEFGQTNHPYLGSAFISKIFYYKRRYDLNKAIALGEQAKEIILPSASEFDRFAYLLSYCYANIDRYQKTLHEFLNFWDAAIKTNDKSTNKQCVFYFQTAKALYYYHVESNNLKASLLSLQIATLPVVNKRVLYESHFTTIMAMSILAQYHLAEVYEQQLSELFPSIKLDEIDDINHNHLLLIYYFHLDKKSNKQQSFAKENLDRSKNFEAEAPLIISRAYADLAGAYYHIPQRAKSLEIAQEGVKYGDVDGRLAYRIAASQFHTQQYDSALVHFQKRLCEQEEDFNSMDFSQNPYPPKDKLYSYHYSYTASTLRWKCRTLYRKSLITKDDDEAIRLLLQGVESGQASIAYLDNYLEGHHPFTFNIYFHQSWNHVTYCFIMLSYYELYKRRGEEKYLKNAFVAMENAKNKLLFKVFSEPDLPSETANELHDEMFKLEEAIRAFQLSLNQENKFLNEAQQQIKKLEELDASLRQQFPDKKLGYKAFNVVHPDSIQASLDKETVVLNFKEIWGNGIQYFISADTQMIKSFQGGGEWRRSLNKLNKMLNSPMQSQAFRRQKIIKHAHNIYQELLAPFEKELAKAKRLIIIPDRNLFYIPFEVLLPSDEVKPYNELNFLVKKYTITYSTSATFMQESKTTPSIKDHSLLAFAPVFKNNYLIPDAERSITSFGNMSKVITGIDENEFKPLINSELEVKGIANILEEHAEKNIFLDKNANKQSLIDALQKQHYQFIHIATHGFVNFHNPTLNGLACYNEDGKDENFLYAAEVENMNIKADLVVLSSCESGIGRIIEGESLMAMNRSFFQAGAKNVLFSLWKVNDEQTKNLMLKFYKNISKDMSYATALREAKLELLKDPHSASPRFWAAFILFGE